MGRLDSKVAIITGGGSGIGEAGALLFGKEGAKVVVAGRTKSKLDEVVATITAHGGTALAIVADVSRSADVQHLIEETIRQYGRIDILWNNAGILDPGTGKIDTQTEAEWDETMDINLKSVFLGCHFAVPQMKKQGGGVIINTTSVAGQKALSGVLPAYHASKGGMNALTRELAHELGPFNIRVNAVCPSRMDTPMNRARSGGRPPTPPPPQPTALRESTPIELVRLALYVCSDEAGPLTGAILNVDGGLSSK